MKCHFRSQAAVPGAMPMGSVKIPGHMMPGEGVGWVGRLVGWLALAPNNHEATMMADKLENGE